LVSPTLEQNIGASLAIKPNQSKTSGKFGAKPLAELPGTLNHSIVSGYFTRGKKTWQQWQDPKP
jgi:hypothetical protein